MKRPVIILFLFMIFVLSEGQDLNSIISEDSIKLINIREVVITANRSGSLLFYTPEAIKSVDSRSIKRYQLRSAPEALTLTPGLFVQKTNHGGGSPFIRGLTGNQTLLLIDGIRLSNSTFRYGPNQYFNTIDIFSISKLEILRGNGSVQYGSDALGGTIQVFTYDPLLSDKFNAGADIQTRLASHGMEQSLRAGINFGNKNYAVKGGLTLRNFGDLVGGDTTGRQTPSGYKERDYDLKARFLLSESTTATIAYQDVHQDDIPVYHKIILEDYEINKMDPQKRKLAYIRINHEFDRKILESMIITASYQFTKENRESRKIGAGIIRNESDRIQSAGFSVQARFSKGDKWTATNGIDIYNDIVRSSRSDHDLVNSVIISKRGLYPDGASMTSLAAFTIHEINLSKWSFTAGTRFNTFIIKADDETTGITRITPTAIVGNLAIMRKLNSRSNIFSSVNSGFRAPNIDDLGSLGIVDFRYEVPNYDLRPEQSVQYQAGFKYFDNNISGEIYLYHNHLYNLITRRSIPGDTIDGYPVYMKENSDRSYIRGIETAVEYKINPSLFLNGSLTYSFGQNITKDEPMRRIPPLFGRLSAEYINKNLVIGTEWLAATIQKRLAAGDKEDNRIMEGGTPGWNILNINTGYTLGILHFGLSLQNIFNVDYRYHGSGINGYGRHLLFTIEARFSKSD